MAIDDNRGESVVAGTWLYDGVAPKPVTIIARSFDYHYALAKEEGELAEGQEPRPLGPDGCLYYVFVWNSPAFDTIDEAKIWAESQQWAPITWDD